MKNIFLSTLLLIAFTLVACDRDENQQGSIDKQNAVSISQVILPPSGGTQTFTVTSDADWDITYSSGIGEIDVSPNTGTAGTKEVKCEAKYAPDKDINVIMYFKYSNGETFAEIPLIQKKPILEIKNSEDASDLESKEFNWYEPEANGKYSFDISSNTDWRFTNNIPDWLEVVIADNDDNNTEFIYPDGSKEFKEISKTVTIKPKDFNLDEGERKNTLTIKSGSGTKNLTFSQPNKTLVAKAENEVGGNIESLQFKACNDSGTPIIVRSAFDEWKLSTENLPDGDWFSPKSGVKGDTDVTITPQANYSREPIHGYINIEGTADGKTGTREIPVKIDEYILTFSLTDQNEEIVDGGEITAGGSHSFRSSGDWGVEFASDNEENWLKITSETSGKGLNNGGTEKEQIVKYEVAKENLYLNKANTGKFILKSKDKDDFTADLTVTQPAFKFSTTAKTIDLGADDTTTHKFEINCSGGWEITNNADWLTVSPTKGFGNETISIEAKSYNTSTTEDRSATLGVYSTSHNSLNDKEKYGYNPIQILVTQKKYTFDVNPDGATFTFDALDNTIETIKVKCSSKWEIELVGDNTSWIIIDGKEINYYKNSDLSGDKDLNITVSKNTDTNSRSGQFKITSTFGGKTNSKTFTVEQNAFVFDTKEESIEMDAISPGATIQLGECMGSWTVSAPDHWISKVNPDSGTGGNQSITIVPEDYITSEPNEDGRTGTVYIISQEDANFVKTINVHQKAHWLIVDQYIVNVNAKPSEATTINVKCPTQWSVSVPDSDSWIKTNILSNSTFTITADENTTGKERRATVTVSSQLYSDVQEVITVTQAAK